MTEPVSQRRYQASLPGMCPFEDALKELSVAGLEERGAIYTRREVVEFILDLLDYTVEKPLYNYRFLEPSFGLGDFLLVALERLITSWLRGHPFPDTFESLKDCICAVELHRDSYASTRLKVIGVLVEAGISPQDAEKLAAHWLICGDFLLTEISEKFDFVAGNPPYVRQELIPDALIAEYRLRYHTIFDRGDLYIPFIERSLSLLRRGGALGFICSDRWMKNRYGRRLRGMVASNYHLRIYVDMVDTPAFHNKVIAYPAITIIANERPGKTRLSFRPEINKSALCFLAKELRSDKPTDDGPVKELGGVAFSEGPWILDSLDQLTLLRKLEHNFPTLEEAGCKIGIGVATGADKAFIGPFDELDVEPDRKLPLAMTRDILSGEVRWRGSGVINPFTNDGQLVDLSKYPKLRRYLEDRKAQIVKRHIAKKTPENWFRTIDRIYPELARKPKLLIPDIKGKAHIVYESGKLYPHHNLYFITSKKWNLKALQAVLQSGIARLFVSIYSIQMRGGYLRFQAQYLRRIRIPYWSDIPEATKNALIEAAELGNKEACNEAVFKLYGLSENERATLGGNGEG